MTLRAAKKQKKTDYLVVFSPVNMPLYALIFLQKLFISTSTAGRESMWSQILTIFLILCQVKAKEGLKCALYGMIRLKKNNCSDLKHHTSEWDAWSIISNTPNLSFEPSLPAMIPAAVFLSSPVNTYSPVLFSIWNPAQFIPFIDILKKPLAITGVQSKAHRARMPDIISLGMHLLKQNRHLSAPF